MVAFQDKPGVHNGGDAGGYGIGNQTGSGFDPENGSDITSSELLISQMAALDVSSVRIELIINGEIQEPIIADATTTKDKFPKIRPGAVVSGIAYIYVNGETEPREARLEETVTGVNKTLPFKVPYYFKAYDLSGTLVKEDEYFARDGIHLEAQTVAPIAGWQCAEDGTTHFGSYVSGVRGDITLNAVLDSGAGLSAVSDNSVLYATATSSDTATITITNATGTPQVSSISTELDLQGTFVPDSSNPLNYTLTVKIKDNPAAVAGGVPVWFSDNTAASITITDDSGITTSVPLMLKNKYTYFLKNHVGAGGTIARGPLDAGGTLAFADAVAVFASGYSVPIPSDRSVVAFKDEATGIIYKETDFPITFNSTNFSSRSITFKALLDFGITAKDAVNAPWSGATSYTNVNNQTGMLYTLEKYSTTTSSLNITLSDYSNSSNLSAVASSSTYLSVGSINSSGTFTVTLTNAVTHDNIPSGGYTYTITITDSGTNTTKYIHIKIAQPGEYKYSLVYQRGDGLGGFINVPITGWQNMDFTPGSSLRFGVADDATTLKMGDLDSSLTGIEAAMPITGWKSTRASNPPIYSTPFPNVGAADCESDGIITLIATTDIGALYNNCRANSNAVMNGDIMLSNGLCVNKLYYNNNKTLLGSYVVGQVLTLGVSGDRKFVMAKALTQDGSSKEWSTTNSDISALNVSLLSGTTSDNPDTVVFSNDSSGKDSAGNLPGSISNYPAFEKCVNYAPSGVTSGSYANGWYLPSIAEAQQMYRAYSNGISIFVSSGYCIMTSSQCGANQYWVIDSGEGLALKNKIESDFATEIYPCHEFSFTAPPQL